MTLLATIWAYFSTAFTDLFTAVSATVNTIISEIPNDEIAILHGATQIALKDLQAGQGADQAFTDALNFVEAQEGAELSKVSQLILQAIIAATAPATGS